MSLQDKASAAGVNSYTGLSDDHRQASIFQGLLDSQDGRPPPAAPETSQAPVEPAASGARPAEQPPAETAPESQEPEGPEYQDLDDYLTKSALDRDAFLDLPVPVKVDGKEGKATLKDLIRSYQTDAYVTQRSQALADERRQWQTQQQQLQTQYTQQLQQAQALVQQQRQQLMGDYGKVDWARLAVEDPNAYNQHWPIAQQRAIALQQAEAQIQQAQQHQALQQQQALQSRLPQEQEALFAARPAWRDQKTFDVARKEIQDYGARMGLTPAEWQSVSFDHRMLVILHDAAQAHKLQAQAPQVLKKVRAAPQMAAPGARVMADPKSAQLNQLKERAFSPRGRKDDRVQAAYFEQLINLGA